MNETQKNALKFIVICALCIGIVSGLVLLGQWLIN